MKDQIEQWEDSAERQFQEKSTMLPNGDMGMKCGCGRLFDPDSEGGVPSPNPYCMPVCGQCLHDLIGDTP